MIKILTIMKSIRILLFPVFALLLWTLSLSARVPEKPFKTVICSEKYGVVFGDFDSDVPNGYGIQYLPGGDRYCGNFRDGKHSGHGRLYSKSGEMILGEFKDGKAEGPDTLIYENGMVYIGEVIGGKATRKGLKYASAVSAGFSVPDFPEVKLAGSQKRFLKKLEKNPAALADREANYKGGGVDKFFREYMYTHTKWPKNKEYESGRVVYEFTVGADGSITDVEILEGEGSPFAKSVRDVLAKGPKWEPAVSEGKFVPQRIRYSIDFVQRW